MGAPLPHFPVALLFFLSIGDPAAAVSSAFSLNLRGVSPQEFSYYQRGPVIPCKDGSGSFSLDRFNDDFCDCVDGTDEPGTSACPNGRFYCKNQRNFPLWIFSSRVDDGICDCCDGSDERDRNINCLSTCLVNDDDDTRRATTISQAEALKLSSKKSGSGPFTNAVHIFKELKTLMLLEMSLVFLLLYQVYRWSTRRGSHLRKRLPR